MKPILLGMNNPLSSRPEHALFPHPPGCTGYRILKLLQTRRPGVTRRQYLNAFDRRNLLSLRQWSLSLAREAAVAFVESVRDTGAVILVLGEEPRRLLELPKDLVHPHEIHGCTWRQLPHPSGRNMWYNETRNRDVAALLLEELYVMATKETV